MSLRLHARRGFTLIELMVGIAILALILALGVPSLRSWLMSQRVSAIASELVTDLQLARSTAISSSQPVWVTFKTGSGFTCYTVHIALNVTPCNCAAASGNSCGASGNEEIKTVKVASSTGVTLTANQIEKYQRSGEFSAANAPLTVVVSDGGTKVVRVVASPYVQRPSMCVPSGSTVPGIKAC